MTWKVLALGSSILGAKIARGVVNTGWNKTKGSEPPRNAASPDVQWGEALLFAAVSGAVVGVARSVMQRQAANVYRTATGDLPAPVKEQAA